MNNLTKFTNKCCLKNINNIIIDEGWSYFCKECGRYNYDQDGWSLNLKCSIEKLEEVLLERKGKDRIKLIKELKKVKSKRFKKALYKLI